MVIRQAIAVIHEDNSELIHVVECCHDAVNRGYKKSLFKIGKTRSTKVSQEEKDKVPRIMNRSEKPLHESMVITTMVAICRIGNFTDAFPLRNDLGNDADEGAKKRQTFLNYIQAAQAIEEQQASIGPAGTIPPIMPQRGHRQYARGFVRRGNSPPDEESYDTSRPMFDYGRMSPSVPRLPSGYGQLSASSFSSDIRSLPQPGIPSALSYPTQAQRLPYTTSAVADSLNTLSLWAARDW